MVHIMQQAKKSCREIDCKFGIISFVSNLNVLRRLASWHSVGSLGEREAANKVAEEIESAASSLHLSPRPRRVLVKQIMDLKQGLRKAGKSFKPDSVGQVHHVDEFCAKLLAEFKFVSSSARPARPARVAPEKYTATMNLRTQQCISKNNQKMSQSSYAWASLFVKPWIASEFRRTHSPKFLLQSRN